MSRQPRPPGVKPGKPGRLPANIASERRQLILVLCGQARTVLGLSQWADVYGFVTRQSAWIERWPEHGPPGEDTVREIWRTLYPGNVDLCANLDREEVQRTAAEERRAAIARWRETVNRWYSIERELIVQRTETDEKRELAALEKRSADAQVQRLAAERELAAACSAIDDESFDSAALRSEVMAILARNRHHFTADEAARMSAVFAPNTGPAHVVDPDMPDYMQ